MQAHLRQQLREAIDANQRARRQTLIATGEITVCSGCGGELTSCFTGCKHCWDRKRRQARRAT